MKKIDSTKHLSGNLIMDAYYFWDEVAPFSFKSEEPINLYGFFESLWDNDYYN